jgi:hypothetical protein
MKARMKPERFVIKLERMPLGGSISLRVERPVEDFYAAAGAVLQISPAALMRPALREHRRKVLRAYPGLKRQLQRLSPHTLHGV